MKTVRAIAIDGPAAAGKTTTAKLVAAELGYVYCDTGAMYRTLAVGFLDRGLTVDSSVAEFESCLCHLSVSISTSGKGEQRMLLNDVDVTDRLRTEEVSTMASVSSAIPSVRAKLKRLQRLVAEENNVVMEGRDIGTVILPQADLKIFLTANLNERAIRRQKDLEKKYVSSDFFVVRKEMEERDTRDSSRAAAPLKPASDAILIDNTIHTIEETVQKIVELAKEKFWTPASTQDESSVPAEPISRFDGNYFFLSNFYETDILYEGIHYSNSEAAFQAAKTLDRKQREAFAAVKGRDAKHMGRRLDLRPDWEQVKNDVMLQILRAKFAPGTDLAESLISTGDRPLIEGNMWHDNYWGACNCDRCKGKNKRNHLGRLLEKVRAELVQGKEKKDVKYVVVIYYNFDPECKAYPFEDEESAKKFLRETFVNEVRIDTEENGYNTEAAIQEDGWYAKISNHFLDRDDITELRIAEIAN